jgi:putative transposase
MKKTRFTESQIVGILAELKGGVPAKDLSRKYNVTPTTIYSWRAKYDGLDGAELRRMKDMELQISRLERIVARQSVELLAAQEIIKGKW